ncbi:MAG: Sulfur oxidation protein [uncultured Sulfurovum sp.]|uniref:Sulfur oxidation protein n=1 Tax=uncultured Sulfurovum sp. TaxID=269237 RepID=A0A6S6SLB5_9BACT|nr:MAG: Sulfur oxidation protein [uncultured Sulfurovum sp.]
MERRNFLTMGVVAAAAILVPGSLQAINFRETKAKAWEAEKSSEAIKEMFGEEVFSGPDKLIAVTDKIKMTAPKLAENGGSIPIRLRSDLDIETIAFFQDANPRAATVVFTVPEGQKVDYSFRVKMRQTAYVTVVAKTRDGKLHTLNKEIDVSIGGCGG